ncbi:MAG: hypothetical protein HRT35_15980 [Algicola sp.]|nr:hypothetical protein [Algicola sp.]
MTVVEQKVNAEKMIELTLAKGQQVAEYTKVELDNQQEMGIFQHADSGQAF